ncbi:MAG: hypothetical protein BJ554DRAFT_6020 [Olpidium bornovanus]|uniref:Uncharacterized protein n=1 Tax=Olpidium bornovanus TaxID=278681 RepID=A0A8H8DKJ1_9FUNG|nr:MAG: hypothetical protein BJ554DRAFT_6020 [Olpidium bornovanus]
MSISFLFGFILQKSSVFVSNFPVIPKPPRAHCFLQPRLPARRRGLLGGVGQQQVLDVKGDLVVRQVEQHWDRGVVVLRAQVHLDADVTVFQRREDLHYGVARVLDAVPQLDAVVEGFCKRLVAAPGGTLPDEVHLARVLGTVAEGGHGRNCASHGVAGAEQVAPGPQVPHDPLVEVREEAVELAAEPRVHRGAGHDFSLAVLEGDLDGGYVADEVGDAIGAPHAYGKHRLLAESLGVRRRLVLDKVTLCVAALLLHVIRQLGRPPQDLPSALVELRGLVPGELELAVDVRGISVSQPRQPAGVDETLLYRLW